MHPVSRMLAAATLIERKVRRFMVQEIGKRLTINPPTGLQESAPSYLLQECRGNTESWACGWKWVLDFLHGEGNAAKMPAKPPNPAEPGMSIFSTGSGAGAGGREAGGAAPGGHLFGLRAALLPLSAGSLAAVERGYAS